MIGALIILGVTTLIGFILWMLDRKHRHTPSSQASVQPEESETETEECCGMHAVCEKQLLTPVSADIEYYDDEELDAFAGRDAHSYTEAETEAFREVLLTLPPEEVASWSRSIQLRGITLPQAVRDELLMIVAEQRS